MSVNFQIPVGHPERCRAEEPDLGLGLHRHWNHSAMYSRIFANYVHVPYPERRVPGEASLDPNELALTRTQKHHTGQQRTFFPPRRQQHIREAVGIDALRLEDVVVWRQ